MAPNPRPLSASTLRPAPSAPTLRRHPDPPGHNAARRANRMTTPRVAERVVPAPAPVLEWRPTLGHFRLPHCAQLRLHPLSGAIQIRQAITLRDVRTG